MRRASLLVILLLLAGCGSDPAALDAAAKPDAKPEPKTKTEPDATKPEPSKPEPSKPEPKAKPEPLSAERAATLRKTFTTKLDEGRKQTKAGKYVEGIALYHEALAIEPSNPAALAELGWAAFQAEQLDLAQGATMQAMLFSRKAEQQGMIFYNLGRIAEARGEPAKAVEHYRDSLARRDNATVTKRLDELLAKGEAEAEAPPSAGLATLATGVTSIDAACKQLTDAQCDELFLIDESACRCELALGDEASGWAVLAVGESSPVDNGMWFPAVKTSAGWTLFEAVAWVYNPGAFGIWEEASWSAPEQRDLLPGGELEWVLRLGKSRSDSDMGLNEFESESYTMTLVCAREADRAWCTQPLLIESSYERDVEFPDQDLGDAGEPITHEGLPISSKFSCTIELGEQVVIRDVVGLEDAATGWIADLRGRPAGSYPLAELLGKSVTSPAPAPSPTP